MKQKPNGEHKKFPKLRFLVIDDEVAIGEAICFAIDMTGNDTVRFSNPADAVKDFRKNPSKYDGVFTDLSMPQMSGEMVIERIRKITQEIPIVICTATGGIFTTEDLVKMNVLSLIAKPFELSDIELAVKQIQENYMMRNSLLK